MAAPLEKTLYAGSFIHSASLADLDYCPSALIGVDETGKIAFVERDVDVKQLPIPSGWESAKVIRLRGEGFFFPGFIDTHIHASQYPNAGVFGKSTLLDWLNTYTFPLESSFTDLKKAAKIYNRVVARTLSHGTTTACYYATIHVPATNLLADICLSRGQRAFVGRVCMDSDLSPDFYRDASAEDSLACTEACISHIRKIDPGFSLVSPVITPRFAPSCSVQSMTSLGALHASTGIPVQTHISENLSEIDLVASMFPDHSSYADVYDKTGLLTSKTILAHAIHLTPEERSLVRARDAKISHCPASNTAITSGRAKVRDLLNEGLSIGLGTDVSGGATPSLLSQAREAIYVSRHVAMTPGQNEAKLSVAEVLYLATRGGAKVVGLEDRIGGFEVGMEWDAQMVRFARAGDDEDEGLGGERDGLVEIFGNESWEDKVAKWLYTGDDRNTKAVWCRGRLVHAREGWNA
jgi:guanine deaminase